MTEILPPPSPNEDLAGLGRRHAPDPGDHGYALERPRVSPLVTAKYWLALGPALDQGGTSQCVIYATDRWLTTRPVVNFGFKTTEERTRIYKEVQKRDEWPGEDYDGTSVRASFKYLKEKGLCSEYRWAFDLETAIAYILTTGPLVMGTDWTMDMFTPDRDGYIAPTGQVVGGHAWLAQGANRKYRNPDGSLGRVRKLGSWGIGWGQNGKAWITFNDFERLLLSQGEAAVATEVKAAPR